LRELLQFGPRVVVIGSSGSGKSTFSKQIASIKGWKHIELDALNLEENWKEAELEVFRARVRAAIDCQEWVADGNYSKVRDLTYPIADTIIWLDLPFIVVFSSMVCRTFRRYYKKEVLWNNNRERLWPQFFAKDSLFLWVIKTHRKKRRDYVALMQDEQTGKKMVRFRSRKEVNEFVQTLVAGQLDCNC
jgi:adenylate kinase family enzyme